MRYPLISGNDLILIAVRVRKRCKSFIFATISPFLLEQPFQGVRYRQPATSALSERERFNANGGTRKETNSMIMVLKPEMCPISLSIRKRRRPWITLSAIIVYRRLRCCLSDLDYELDQSVSIWFSISLQSGSYCRAGIVDQF